MKRFVLVALALGATLLTPIHAQEKNSRVVLETNHGKIVIEFFDDKAPISVKNFLQYVDDKHYDGLIFHRIIADFMIQGGGYEKGMKERKTRAPIKNEAGNGIANARGTIAMARTNVPDSATSQFFINTMENKFLDRANARDGVGYAVFGKVIEGMDVVDKIRRVETNKGDVPLTDVVIKTVRRVTK